MPSTTRARLTRTGTCAAGVLAGALALSGCGFGQLQLHTLADAAVQSAARITLESGTTTAHDGKVAPDGPLVIHAASGRLTAVEVTGPGGALPGTLSTDATVWTSSATTLEYGSQYQVKAAAVDRLGAPDSLTETLQTLQPTKFLEVDAVSPSGTVGVAIPMRVTLSRPVAGDAARARIEKRLVVKADGKVITGGAWRWDNDTVLLFRPPSFWPGRSTITLEANLKGLRVSKSVWGKSDSVNTWTTGPAMISYVNLATHELKVTRNGKTLRVIPITAGKPGFDTRSGTKVILEKFVTHRMDAASGGTPQDSPDYYNLVVKYAMRLTWSGEFLHAAPWSVGSQGRANVSHGCTGMSLSDAEWLYGISEIGDPVIFTGSDRPMTMDNGIGDWNVPLARWAAGYDS